MLLEFVLFIFCLWWLLGIDICSERFRCEGFHHSCLGVFELFSCLGFGAPIVDQEHYVVVDIVDALEEWVTGSYGRRM